MSTDSSVSLSSLGLEAAASELHVLRQIQVQRALAASVVAVLAALVAAVDVRLSVALAAGALAEGVLALVARSNRRDVLFRLASHPRAYVLPEVARLGASLTTPRRRSALARMIVGVLRDTGGKHSPYLIDRVAARAPVLVAVAASLADERMVVEPAAMACLQRLLVDGAASPLLNPSLPSIEVDAVVAFVLSGIRPRQASS